ncbi:MAG: GTPase Era [Alphaproteobacteria bacterium]|nr:GTPase Era [Alphaproteobacteria bacterium]
MTQAESPKTQSGFVAIVGAPNAGKSTLLNGLIGQKISIVSPKAQTTRMKIVGVMTEDSVQVAFIDTPGIFEPKRRLDRAMVQAAWQSLEGADAIVLLVDASGKIDDKVNAIVDELKRRKRRVVLALNKADVLEPAKLLPLADQLNATGIVSDIFMISALKGDGVDDLKKYLITKMPEGHWLFDADQLSDLPSQLLAAEITREQLFRQLQQELPYAATVVPESWENNEDGSATIRQRIVVAREGHRPIVLGKGGSRIKSVGQAARREIEQLTGQRVHLFLEVKVDEKWQDRPEFYRMFGLEFGSR